MQDESKRIAQHLLAKEIVELAHGAADAKKAEIAHNEAFSHGTNTFSLGAIRRSLSQISSKTASEGNQEDAKSEKEQQLLAYKQAFAASSTTQPTATTSPEQHKTKTSNVVTIPLSLIEAGSFPLVLQASGLVSSRSEGHRLVANQGAYVVIPNSGTPENPHGLKWEPIPAKGANPHHYLVDWEALVLRSGKSKIQVCRVIPDEQFEAEGLSCPGWNQFRARQSAAAGKG